MCFGSIVGNESWLRKIPILGLRYNAVLPSQAMARRERCNSVQQRHRFADRSKVEITRQARRINTAAHETSLQKSSHLGGKHEVAIRPPVIKRLDPPEIAKPGKKK